MIEITKVSSKGQVVIPSNIRNELNLRNGSRLVVTKFKNMVLLKKININLKEEFKELTKIGEKFARGKNIKNEEDVLKIIHKGRGFKVD